MASIPVELETALSGADTALSAVEGALQPFLAAPPQKISALLKEPLDNARLHTTFAATVASLMFCELCESCVPFLGNDDEQLRSTGL